MEWISVKDRLPEKEEVHYLIYDGYEIVMGMIDNGKLITLEFIEIDDATHWMPLPKPPKED